MIPSYWHKVVMIEMTSNESKRKKCQSRTAFGHLEAKNHDYRRNT